MGNGMRVGIGSRDGNGEWGEDENGERGWEWGAGLGIRSGMGCGSGCGAGAGAPGTAGL